jgi:stage V sporulation protein R
MVAAHVFGHVHFFKNNIMFQKSDRNMVHRAAERATRIDKYIEQYGLDKVEGFMDMAFAIDNHIDWQKGIFRKRYENKRIVEEKVSFKEFEDLLNIKSNDKRSVRRRTEGAKIPPYPERDLLWFLINYAPLEEWERDVLSIIREESYYFYPIVMTKIMNEGFASFIHAELMYKCHNIDEQDHLEFCKCHSSVVSPGNPFQINPYYLGFKIFTDIREKWDDLYKNGQSEIDGMQKILQVVKEEDDASFLRNYLTPELAMELGLFNYGYKYNRNNEKKLTEEHGIVELKDRDLSKIVENIIRPTINYGAPLITIEEVDGETLLLEHKDSFGALDIKYTEKVMEYLFKLWGGPIELKTYDKSKENFSYYYDESGFDII